MGLFDYIPPKPTGGFVSTSGEQLIAPVSRVVVDPVEAALISLGEQAAPQGAQAATQAARAYKSAAAEKLSQAIAAGRISPKLATGIIAETTPGLSGIVGTEAASPLVAGAVAGKGGGAGAAGLLARLKGLKGGLKGLKGAGTVAEAAGGGGAGIIDGAVSAAGAAGGGGGAAGAAEAAGALKSAGKFGLKGIGKGAAGAGVGIGVDLATDWALDKAGMDQSNWRRFLSGAAGGAAGGAAAGLFSGGTLSPLLALGGAVLGGGWNVLSHELFDDEASEEDAIGERDKITETLRVAQRYGMSRGDVAETLDNIDRSVAIRLAQMDNPTPTDRRDAYREVLGGLKEGLGEMVEASRARQAEIAEERRQEGLSRARAQAANRVYDKWMGMVIPRVMGGNDTAARVAEQAARSLGGEYGTILRAQAAQQRAFGPQYAAAMLAMMQGSPTIEAWQNQQSMVNQTAQQLVAQAMGNAINPPQQGLDLSALAEMMGA